jgi:hypothetical protein
VPLRKDGAWIDQATYTLFAWDAGTDNGKTYAAADADAMPRQSVRLNASPHFVDASVLKPVGTVTITRLQRTAAVN